MGKKKGRRPQKRKGYDRKLKSRGWYNEPGRHALAARGIPTTGDQPAGININVIGMDSSQQSTSTPARPGLPTGLVGPAGFRPGVGGAATEPPVVSFAEDQEIDAQVKALEKEVADLQGKIKSDEVNVASLEGERGSLSKIHKAEMEQLVTKLAGRKPGFFWSPKDMPPEDQKKVAELRKDHEKQRADLELKVQTLKSEIKSNKARLSARKADVVRRKNYLEDIKMMREKEQRKRVETLEQTRTLNRLIREGQR